MHKFMRNVYVIIQLSRPISCIIKIFNFQLFNLRDIGQQFQTKINEKAANLPAKSIASIPAAVTVNRELVKNNTTPVVVNKSPERETTGSVMKPAHHRLAKYTGNHKVRLGPNFILMR